MKRTPAATLFACALFLADSGARAQAPGTASRPAPPAETIPPFETAQSDSTSWVGRFGSTNCGWFDMGDGVLLLDTGGTADDAKNLLSQASKTVPDKPVKWVVMTHLHPDSNNGFATMLPTDVTLVVNERAMTNLQGLVRGAKGKAPTLVGVSGTLALVGKTQSLEFHATPGPAHTNHDLWVFSPASNVVYVGDLVTPGRCPMTSDVGTDPAGWLAQLDRLDALHSSALVATRGPWTTAASAEIAKTRAYLMRLLELLREMKAKNAPEARVSGEIAARKIPDYCPVELDTINALELYRRMTPDGKFAPVRPTKPASQAPAPAPKS